MTNEDNNTSNAVHWLGCSAVHTNDELDKLLAGLSESERVQALSSNNYQIVVLEYPYF